METKYKFNRPSLIVFEGLDATGKTTQAAMFKDWPNVFVTHQPSGAPGIGKQIYGITEDAQGLNDTARQFLHLACHAQHYQDEIVPTMVSGVTVIMDRFWWSTVAYGYFSQKVANNKMTRERWAEVAQLPVPANVTPDVIFMFTKPYKDDPHNNQDLIAGYSWLGQMDVPRNNSIFYVPTGDPDNIHSVIVDHLLRKGLISEIV